MNVSGNRLGQNDANSFDWQAALEKAGQIYIQYETAQRQAELQKQQLELEKLRIQNYQNNPINYLPRTQPGTYPSQYSPVYSTGQVDWQKYLPYLLIGGGVLAVILMTNNQR